MGVFRVRNSATGVSLIGTSTDVPAMLNRQRFQLQMGGHPNGALQRDFSAAAATGDSAFEFEVLDLLEPSDDSDVDPRDDLLELEMMWRERFSARGERLYNSRVGKLT